MDDLRELLRHLDPGVCDYTEWTEVGMALKHEGYSADDWEAWSSRDRARYHEGECRRKWNSFNGAEKPVTGGTIFQLAVDHGWDPDADIQNGFLDWDAEFVADGHVIDPGWVESRELEQPDAWHPGRELKKYLEALFEPSETVGIVTQSRVDNEKGKHVPRNAGISFTVSDILENLAKHGDDIGAVIGDYDKEAGAWVRFNPLDGNGAKNQNVTEYRYALVESDTLEIEKQNALIRELELPVAVLVHSGSKSLHAIVRIDAPDYATYQKRVDKLYKVCSENGLEIDKQNKNPSRLSRLPGCMRGNNRQYIVAANIGRKTWDDWVEYIDSVNDHLPDFENLDDVWDNMPTKAPELIEGVLRQGHKMLIVGGSKTGKSFLQIELCIAIAEGMSWVGWECTQGRVLYVNLELDRASCLQRFKDVYEALKAPQNGRKNLDIWNLRGEAEKMDKLVPKLVRRARKNDYKAIIIDPIYKVLTGDENSAEQMAKFCNQFDKIAQDTGAAVIYCHHHSKGAQGGKKSMDRASGSGVFARDPDALLDLIELPLDEDQTRQITRNAALDAGSKWLKKHYPEVYAEMPQAHDFNMPEDYVRAVKEEGGKAIAGDPEFIRVMHKAEEDAASFTALRIDGTLREFRKFKPVDIWFKYPVHEVDGSGMLMDIEPEDNGYSRSKRNLNKSGKRNKTDEERKEERNAKFDELFAMLDVRGKGIVSKKELMKTGEFSADTLKRRVKEQADKYYFDDKGNVRIEK